MDKNIILNINMSHVNGEKTDVMEFATEAKYTKENDGLTRVSYAESMLTGLDGTTTTITLDQNRVILQRDGTYNMVLILEEGKQYFGAYCTPFGNVHLAVSPRKVDVNNAEDHLDLRINYEMIVSDASAGVFDMHISSVL